MRTGGERTSRWRPPFGRVAASVLALGGLSVFGLSVFAFGPSVAAAATRATRATSASVISTAENAKLGTILVSGNTVYVLKPSRTACTASCLKAWPPVLLPKGVTAPTAGPGVDASKLATATAAKGALQITYAGKRLYWFVKDTAPGQVHGDTKNKWGKWSTVVVASSSASSDTSTTTTPAPTTAAPPAAAQTSPPETAAPETSPPETSPPATSPPATSPPATSPPATRPPSNSSPGTGGVAF